MIFFALLVMWTMGPLGDAEVRIHRRKALRRRPVVQSPIRHLPELWRDVGLLNSPVFNTIMRKHAEFSGIRLISAEVIIKCSADKGRTMPKCSSKLKDLRIQAGLSQNALSRLADLDRGTISNAENGKEVQEVTISKMLKPISARLGRDIEIASVLQAAE